VHEWASAIGLSLARGNVVKASGRHHGGRVFDRVDTALRLFLLTGLPKGTTVTFDALSRNGVDGKAEPSPKPTISAVLYSVQEDTSARAQGVQGIRDFDGTMTARRAFPRRYTMSYDVTAAAVDVAGQHALLGAITYLLSQHDVLPIEHADAEMAKAGSINLMLAPAALPATEEGRPRRLHLHLVVIAPMASPLITDLPRLPEAVEIGASRHERPAPPPPNHRGRGRSRIVEGEPNQH
jgi:hypothetical protein